ncbi:MAG: hypothetical protein KGM49_06535 [Sphingomonadales bacterium]|nr:hypothetical protein [Sphingomonadales bacterium]
MTEPDPAKSRFIAMQFIRLSGAAFALLGLLIIARKIAMPAAAGYAFVAVGMFDLLVMPMILARRWRTPPQ